MHRKYENKYQLRKTLLQKKQSTISTDDKITYPACVTFITKMLYATNSIRLYHIYAIRQLNMQA